MCSGYIFTLPTGVAFACNSANRPSPGALLDQLRLPGKARRRLRAVAVERSRSGRSGIYDVRVTTEDGTVIAEFRGHSRTIEGTLV
jgi:acyl-CoA thioesterase